MQDIRIVILQRGWVFVGTYTQKGMTCKLNNAQCIRRWGTTKGLGELAKNGPTSATQLESHGIVEFHRLTSIATIHCEATKWESILQ